MENFVTILALLICPLMMLFCMRGHGHGHGHGHKGHAHDDSHMNHKINKLEEQNQQLLREIDELKKNRSL